MDTKAYMDEFKVRFAKLKSNREKIPLEQLTTKYAKAYNALVGWSSGSRNTPTGGHGST